jgi:1-phosphatidylinositol-4-phosphate 5-kinase
MPFVPDGTAATSSGTTNQDADFHSPHPLSLSSSNPSRPHRTQSSTGISHLPIRVPTTVPEIEDQTQEVLPVSPVTSPRRPRASTGLSRTRLSTEQRPPEEDASWWTEEIHKRREIRRRWREAEDVNTVIIGNKVDTNHPNYVTAYNMLTGLRVAVCLISQS